MAANCALAVQPVTIPARDGFPLAGRLYLAGQDSPYVLIAPAVGVKQRLYDKFARFLCERGFSVVTFDYRGMGDSRPPRLAGFQATMRDWGEHDLAGVIDWAAARSDRPLLAVGHSAGGQLFGIAPNNDKVRALVAVAVQSGYWRFWPFPRRYWMATLWYVLMPALARLFRYFPGKRLGFGDDLPAGMALEWARWCRSPAYIEDRRLFQTFSARIRYYSFENDPFAPKRAVEDLMSFYTRSEKEGVQAGPIGHFGFFKENQKQLWAETADWLERQS